MLCRYAADEALFAWWQITLTLLIKRLACRLVRSFGNPQRKTSCPIHFLHARSVPGNTSIAMFMHRVHGDEQEEFKGVRREKAK